MVWGIQIPALSDPGHYPAWLLPAPAPSQVHAVCRIMPMESALSICPSAWTAPFSPGPPTTPSCTWLLLPHSDCVAIPEPQSCMLLSTWSTTLSLGTSAAFSARKPTQTLSYCTSPRWPPTAARNKKRRHSFHYLGRPARSDNRIGKESTRCNK